MDNHELDPKPNTDSSDDGLNALRESWELLGEEDPLWAILSAPDKQGGKWGLDEFLETGINEVEEIKRYLAGLPIQISFGRALDFGCGVGRVSRALAGVFANVDGVDISKPMLAGAERINADKPQVRFHRVTEPRLPFEDDVFDLTYSRLVLQHMETRFAMKYVADFVRVLKPGGLAVFQAPSRPLVDFEVAPSEIALDGGTAYIEMHAHSRELVEETVAKAGGRMVDVREDACAGPAFESLKYAVTV